MEHYKNLDLSDIVYFCEFDLIEKTEQWIDVVGYEGLYQVSDLGRVKNLIHSRNRFSKILKLYAEKTEYLSINFCVNNIKKNKFIHKLVAMAFLNHVPCGYVLVVDHKDFNRKNNCVTNLKITSQRNNTNKKHIKSSSKYTGVSWHKRHEKWYSYIRINGKLKYLGNFTDENEASNAYEKALEELLNSVSWISSS